MSNLPDPTFKPNDVDALIQTFGIKLEPERKAALMEKLENQRRSIQQGQRHRPQDRGRGR